MVGWNTGAHTDEMLSILRRSAPSPAADETPPGRDPRPVGNLSGRPPSSHPSPPPLISARGVRKTYRTGDVAVEALRGVDLDIAAGEMVVIMGPSGNGKTTLLNCCSGLDDIDGGRVEIDGLDLHALSDRARTAHRAARMGFVFQSFNLIPVLSAAENCELPLLAAGARPREARRRALALLERVELADRARHRPAELSGGEQQRVAIARSLVAEPAVVWADEPTGNLDSRTARSVMELFAEVNASGQTLVIVTHDPSLGERADRVVTVTDGRIDDDRPGDDAPVVDVDGVAPPAPARAGRPQIAAEAAIALAERGVTR
jgi:putative ABC transport system ATP-binding protein